jgi:hypothetical protein
MTPDDEIAAARRCIAWCEAGFAKNSAELYEPIIAELAPFRDANRTTGAASRMASGGRYLLSPRFAYPHIKDRLVERLEELGAKP